MAAVITADREAALPRFQSMDALMQAVAEEGAPEKKWAQEPDVVGNAAQ